MKIVTLNRRVTKNVGDLASGPVQYFPEYSHCPQVEISGWSHAKEGERRKWMDRVSAADLIVVGGGGLLEWDKHFASLDVIRFIGKKSVIWGAGQNHHELQTWADIRRPFERDYSHFSLVGVRDFGFPLEWVPCASCLSPLFDGKREVTREFAFLVNSGLGNPSKFYPKGVAKEDLFGNTFVSMEDVVDYLGSAETVVTSSFHGAYWATLLGKKVVAIPVSSKVYTMKHVVPFAHGDDWYRYVPLARAYPEALEECRAANRVFAERVFNL